MPAASQASKNVLAPDTKKVAAQEMADALGHDSKDRYTMISTKASKHLRQMEQPIYTSQGLFTTLEGNYGPTATFDISTLPVYILQPSLPFPLKKLDVIVLDQARVEESIRSKRYSLDLESLHFFANIQTSPRGRDRCYGIVSSKVQIRNCLVSGPFKREDDRRHRAHQWNLRRFARDENSQRLHR